MRAETLLRDGDPDAALAALSEAVRDAPQEARLRVFLFQLLCVQGDWPRAIQQLRTAATLDPKAGTMAQMYRAAIICERQREEVFAGQRAPMVLGEPDDWIAALIEALKLHAHKEYAAAEELRGRAFEAAPALPGTLDSAPFGWIADADPRLGPVCELIVNGRYYWAPFSAIHRITLEPPADLRDRVWMPATVQWGNGGSDLALLPTRYPGSATSPDPRHRLSAATGWQMEGDRVLGGLGQRLLATDTGECALMDLRELTIGPAPVTLEVSQSDEARHG
ncbi:type VI secretion system accessory protein TagJ [Salipiger bermudensis]|uniref:type VI secretion system accessory protein TagJ n=1 Tax=Salipiger bermudensis TaxID=344736 RepID=UPI001A8C738F|nr:type VI secretion system accessory protein TagJ [Salipiger bermudensis]MBN9676745.1 tetratricopeptide repeat protein [Salipiger bermudensis]